MAKHRLGCRWYVRYVDDVVMLADSPDRLRRWRDAMADFLADRLKLSLREPEVEPTPARRGVSFVGWRTWRDHRLVGRQTLRALDRRLAAVERQAMRPAFGGAGRRVSLQTPPPSARRRPGDARADLPALAATLASYVELYGRQRLLGQRLLGLRPARLPRFGWALAAGFPHRRAADMVLRALRRGVAVLWLDDHRARARAPLLLPAA